LRHWLTKAGMDPDRDVRIVVVPPAQVFRNLAAGTIDGFCAGEPWNSIAVQEGHGWCRLVSATEMPGHVEKVLMVRSVFAEQQPAEHRKLLLALEEACAWCDDFTHRADLCELLSDRAYLNVPAPALTASLVGPFDLGNGVTNTIPDFHVFHRGRANLPDPYKAENLQAGLCSAGLIPAEAANPNLPRQLFRDDLYRSLVSSPTQHANAESSDLSGVAS
jgi:ABC-type nitrate/sulfonate/bicarbonate transport system substrate-binding protein